MKLLCFPPKQIPAMPRDVEPSWQEASTPSQVCSHLRNSRERHPARNTRRGVIFAKAFLLTWLTKRGHQHKSPLNSWLAKPPRTAQGQGRPHTKPVTPHQNREASQRTGGSVPATWTLFCTKLWSSPQPGTATGL